MKKASRRQFIKKTALGTAGLAMGFSAKSYNSILGANDRVRVGIVGFSNRAKGSLIPSLLKKSKMMNFEIVGVSDIWNRRREEGQAYLKEKSGKAVTTWRNNEEMYDQNEIDAVIISTADFQHGLCRKAFCRNNGRCSSRNESRERIRNCFSNRITKTKWC